MSGMGFALRVLGVRGHSRRELEVKLLRKGFSVECVEEVLERLSVLGLVDDVQFGSALIQSRSRRKPLGKVRMRAELRKKGVSESVIGGLLEGYDSGELCFRAAEKKFVCLHGKNEAERRKKLEVFLCNRGFEWHDIQKVVMHFFGAVSNVDSFV